MVMNSDVAEHWPPVGQRRHLGGAWRGERHRLRLDQRSATLEFGRPLQLIRPFDTGAAGTLQFDQLLRLLGNGFRPQR